MKCLVLLAISLGISLAWPAGKQEFDALEDPSWKVWKSFHNKEYENVDEERIRNFIWQDNLKRIVSHNQAHKYKLAMNHLGDLVSLTLELPEVINMKLPLITPYIIQQTGNENIQTYQVEPAILIWHQVLITNLQGNV